jgi:photosystem II stability/assembly factor-like uncharacterized protein
MKTKLFLTLFLFFYAFALHAQWVAKNKNYKGHVNTLFTNGNNLYVGTEGGGVFLSTDNGASWNAVNTGLTNTNVRCFAMDGNNLYAGTWGGGIFLSTNDGTSWTAVNNGLTNNFVVCLAASGSNLFVGTGGGGVFFSANSGTSWTAINNGLNHNFVGSLAVNGDNLFVGINGVGVFRSTNNGESWKAMNTGLTNSNITSLVLSGSNLFADVYGTGIFRSDNYGVNWTHLTAGLTDAGVQSLVVSGSNLFMGTNSGVLLSQTNGESWSVVNYGLSYYDFGFKALAVSGTNVYAVNYGNSIWSRPLAEFVPPSITSFTPSSGVVGTSVTITGANFSSNPANNIVQFNGIGGRISESRVSGKVTACTSTSITVTVPDVAISGEISVRVLDGETTYSSTNFTVILPPPTITSFWPTTGPTRGNISIEGTNFDAVAGNTIVTVNGREATITDVSSTTIRAIVPPGATTGKIAVTVVGKVATSTNDFTVFPIPGLWVTSNNGLYSTYKYLKINTLIANGNNLYAGTNVGVFRSIESGNNWQEVPPGLLTGTSVEAFAVSGNTWYAVADGNIFLSTNNGDNWSAVNSESLSYINNLLVSGSNLYASTSLGVFLSANGSSWKAVNSGLIGVSIYVLSLGTIGSDLFAGTTAGVFRSRDGTNWVAVNVGLANTYVRSLVVSGSKLYAGTEGGVFLSTNNGDSWTSVSTGLTNTYVNSLVLNGSNLYAGTKDGIFLSSVDGSPWEDVNTGLDDKRVTLLAVGGSNLYASFEYGPNLWSRPVADLMVPIISSFAPSSGPTGTTLTITGINFSPNPADNIVKFNGVIATITASTTSSLTVTVPIGAATGKISVSVAGNTAISNNSFGVDVKACGIPFLCPSPNQVYSPQTYVQTFLPVNPTEKVTVSFSQLNFPWGGDKTLRVFNGPSTSSPLLKELRGTELPTNITSTAIGGELTFLASWNGITPSWAATISCAPETTIESFAPLNGPVGSTITITGTNFSLIPSENLVKFNGVKALVTASTLTSITAIVPTGATKGAISVTVGKQIIISSIGFGVSPTITSFSPASGAPGTSVIISGTEMGYSWASPMVTFNGQVAKVTSSSATSVTVIVPNGATTGKISIRNDGLVGSSPTDFVVLKFPGKWIKKNNQPNLAHVTGLVTKGGKLFMSNRAGVFRSTDNGNTWMAIDKGLPRGFSDDRISHLRISEGNLYANVTGDGIFRSTDDGENWTEVNQGLRPFYGYWVRSLVASSTNLYANLEFSLGVFRSSDNGDSWTDISKGLQSSIDFLVASGSNLYAVSKYSEIFLSTNNGDSWKSIYSQHADDFFVNGNDIYIRAGNAIFRSANNGESWAALKIGLSNGTVYSIFAFNGNLCANTGHGFFLSTDNGESWTELGKNSIINYANFFVGSGSNLFAGTERGVFLSTDNGANWSAINNGLLSGPVTCLAQNGSNIYAAAKENGFVTTANNGKNWKTLNSGLTNTDIRALAVSGSNLFAGTAGVLDIENSGGVFLSTNNGTTWTRMNIGLTNTYVTDLAVNGNNLYAATGDGVFLSTNNGTSWTAVNAGLTDKRVQALALSGNNLYASTYTDGVFVSTDNGTGWSPAFKGIGANAPTYANSVVTIGNKLYAGTNAGILMSADNGVSWTPVNWAGLPSPYVKALAASGENLYAIREKGIFMSTNNGESWTSIDDDISTYSFTDFLVGDTELYVGTWEGDIWARPLAELVAKRTQSITFNALPTMSFGADSFTLEAVADSQLPVTYTSSNTAVATISGSTVTIVGSGITYITASQAGNGTFAEAFTVTQTLTVSKANQTILFAPLSAKAYQDANFALPATASSQLPIAYTSGNTSVVTISGNTVTIVGVGTSTITASQVGNDLFNAAQSVSQVLTVNKGNQTIKFTPADKTLGEPAFALTGTASSNLPVSFSSTSDKITINGTQVTLVKAGRASIVASQPGNDRFNPAEMVTQNFCIKPTKPTIASTNNAGTVTLTSGAAVGNQWYLAGNMVSGATNQSISVTASGVYKVQVTVDDCVSEFSEQQPVVITGDVEEEAYISVSPNPVEDALQLSGIIGAVKSIQLFDMTGRAGSVIEIEKNNELYQTSVAHLSPGVYVLRIFMADNVVQVKFIKK